MLKQLLRAVKDKFDFMGLAVIGPVTGPVRFFLSVDPKERLRVSNANCYLSSMMRWERYATSGAADRLWKAVAQSATRQGLGVPTKRDWFRMEPGPMVALIERTAARIGILLITLDEKQRALFDEQQKIVDRFVPPETWKDLRRKAAGTVRGPGSVQARSAVPARSAAQQPGASGPSREPPSGSRDAP